MALTKKVGKQLISIARSAISSLFVESDIDIPLELQDLLTQRRGVFVTLTINKSLRGCIGFPDPVFPLGLGLVQAARSAASSDPRFNPLTENELDKIKIEVTVLTEPALIEVKDQKELPKHITIGTDGLIVKKAGQSGLLLPQVAPEHKWNTKEFLSQTCVKAGLNPSDWMKKDTEVYKFQGDIFSED